MDNIVIGDVWVMNGQSNMAFGLKLAHIPKPEIDSAVQRCQRLLIIHGTPGAANCPGAKADR